MAKAIPYRILYVFLLAFIFSIFSSTFSSALEPELVLYERGDLTDLNATLTGYFSPETGFTYRAFLAVIGNFSYFNSTIPASESVTVAFNRSADYRAFFANKSFVRNTDTLTIVHDITNNFSSNISVEMQVPIPVGCSYTTALTNESFNATTYIGGLFLANYTMEPDEWREVNVSCTLSVNTGLLLFEKTKYNITSDSLAPNYDFNILPDSYMSSTKEPRGVILNNGSVEERKTEWHSEFFFNNDDIISIRVEEVRLWATPFVNTTGNPTENVIYEANLTTCLNEPTNIIDSGEYCNQHINFSSRYVPVIWSEVLYSTLWDYNVDAQYTYRGEDLVYDLDDSLVSLLRPENNSYIDINSNLTYEYLVQHQSDCTIYTNETGLWLPINTSLNVTIGSSYSVMTQGSALDYIWNVLCTSDLEERSEYALFNWTIHINALPVQYQNITYLEWPEDTNYSIDMKDYFTDAELDDLNYTYQPYPILNVNISVNNDTDNITFIPETDFFGERLVQMIVWDPYGRNVTSDVFIINVTPIADPPQIIYWNISNSTWWTTNETYIETPENRTFQFDADAIDPDEVGALPDSWFFWFLDGVLQTIGRSFTWYIDFLQQGLRNITLVVNDTTGLYDSQTWIFNVTNVNIPPTSINITEQAWKQNDTFRVNLSDWFSDVDEEDQLLNYTFTGYLDNLSVAINASTGVLTIVPDTNWVGIKSRWMVITAQDTFNHTNISNNITLTVYPWIAKQLPNITFYEDMWNDTINLSEYYNADNYSFSNLIWYTNATNLFFVLASHGQLNITSAQDWYGNESVLMRVHENITFYNDSSIFRIEVIPVNDPPIINDSTHQIIENTTPPDNWVDLWNYSYDVDNTYTELNYSIISASNPGLLSCSIIGDRYVNCSAPPLNLWGTSILNVSVTDGEYTDYADVELVVFHFNIAPVINDWNVTNDYFFLELSDDNYSFSLFEGTWLNFSINVTDLENDSLYHHWYIDDVLVHNQSDFDSYFDYHSNGNYTIRYLVNQSQNLQDSLEWNITVFNRNRPPFTVNLTAPENESFHETPFLFNWTNTTDPDADAPNAADYWDFVYILQVDDEPTFFTPVIDFQFKNESEYFLDVNLPDGYYYWRVLAYDGLDAAISETRTFYLDTNPAQFDLIIEPNPAEYGLRNVDINWTIEEQFLETAYVNVSYPDGSFLGQFFANTTLTPAELTQVGSYPVTIYVNDKGNNTLIHTELLSVVEDVEPPVIELISPVQNDVLSTNLGLFSYRYTDLNILENCSLYLQKMFIIYDFDGNILYEEAQGPFERVSIDTSIDSGTNYFVMPGLEEDSYRWNVECSDLAGNTAFAPFNRTFRVILQTYMDLDQFPKENEVIPVTFTETGGYRLRAKIYPLEARTSETSMGTLELENYGENTLYDISFLPSVPWVYFDTPIAFLPAGETINVSFEVQSPAYPDDYLYHIVVMSRNGKVLAPGFIEVHEPVKTPLHILKRVIVQDEGYNVTIRLINYLRRPIRLYLEDAIEDMQFIQYDGDDFHTPAVAPAHIVMNRQQVEPNETLELHYFVKKAQLDNFKVPTIITNEPYEVRLEFLQAHDASIFLSRGAPFEAIVLFSSLVIVIIFLVIVWFKTMKRTINL